MTTETLHHGDCLRVMPTMPGESVDLVFTSPPYNCGKEYDGGDDDRAADDYFDFIRNAYREMARIVRPGGYVVMNCPTWIGSPLVRCVRVRKNGRKLTIWAKASDLEPVG